MERLEISRKFQILFFYQQGGIGFEEPPFRFRDFSFEGLRINCALINVKERDVIESNLVQKNDELDEIGVRLLPERFFTPPEQIIQERSDTVRQSVGVQIVVERVVPVFRFETDFNVVFQSSVTTEDFPHSSAKVTFDFENESADAAFRIVRAISENLLREWIHASRSFS